MSEIEVFFLVVGSVLYMLFSPIFLIETEYGLNCLNPCHNRWRYKSLNWFGVIVVTLFFSIILLPYVPFYWFYKLMTVKRKE